MTERGTKDSPVYIRASAEREGADAYLGALEIVNKTLMVAYGVVCCWEIAKILCPPLKVHEDIAKARVRVWWESRHKSRDIHVPHAWVREVYDYAREVPDA